MYILFWKYISVPFIMAECPWVLIARNFIIPTPHLLHLPLSQHFTNWLGHNWFPFYLLLNFTLLFGYWIRKILIILRRVIKVNLVLWIHALAIWGVAMLAYWRSIIIMVAYKSSTIRYWILVFRRRKSNCLRIKVIVLGKIRNQIYSSRLWWLGSYSLIAWHGHLL